MKQVTAEQIADIKVRIQVCKATEPLVKELWQRAENTDGDIDKLVLLKAAQALVDMVTTITRGIEEEMGVDPTRDIEEQLADFLGQVGDGNRSVGARSKDGTV